MLHLQRLSAVATVARRCSSLRHIGWSWGVRRCVLMDAHVQYRRTATVHWIVAAFRISIARQRTKRRCDDLGRRKRQSFKNICGARGDACWAIALRYCPLKSCARALCTLGETLEHVVACATRNLAYLRAVCCAFLRCSRLSAAKLSNTRCVRCLVVDPGRRRFLG